MTKKSKVRRHKKKIVGTTATIAILLGIYAITNAINKLLNAHYVMQNGFQMTSYHPLTFWISLGAGIIWLIAAKLKKLKIWWYIPGILGVIYATYMLFGGIIYGGYFL